MVWEAISVRETRLQVWCGRRGLCFSHPHMRCFICTILNIILLYIVLIYLRVVSTGGVPLCRARHIQMEGRAEVTGPTGRCTSSVVRQPTAFFFFFLLCFSAAHCVLSIAVFSLPVPRMCDLILSSSANIIQSSGRGAKFLRMLHIS